MARPSRRDTLIKTERLLLRAPRRADYSAWARLRANGRLHLQPWEPKWPDDALTLEDWRRRLRAWREGWDEDRAYIFFALSRTDARLLGGVSLTQVRRGPAQMASMGYWLGPDHVGEGYMGEAVQAACDWCFMVLGLFRVEAAVVPRNARSESVLVRAGFEREGLAKQYLEINGVREDHILYAKRRPAETA